MAKKGKAASRKVRDKWRTKEWYKVYAPNMFNQVVLGETPSSDPDRLVGRTTEATVHDLTGDFSKMHVKMKFRIDSIKGLDAHTVFTGHDLTSDYVRRLTRRKRSKTDHVVNVRTKDGYLVRLKPMSVADRRIQSAQESALREIMAEEARNTVSMMTISDLVNEIISGELAKTVAKACKVVVPIKRIEIRKTDVLEMGEPVPESASVTEEPEEESAETAEEEIVSEEEVSEEEVSEGSEGPEESEVIEEPEEVISGEEGPEETSEGEEEEKRSD
ncbi:MAG: 30S ribosomal protein S3ae [Methanomassiliicoccales archaeon]